MQAVSNGEGCDWPDQWGDQRQLNRNGQTWKAVYQQWFAPEIRILDGACDNGFSLLSSLQENTFSTGLSFSDGIDDISTKFPAEQGIELVLLPKINPANISRWWHYVHIPNLNEPAPPPPDYRPLPSVFQGENMFDLIKDVAEGDPIRAYFRDNFRVTVSNETDLASFPFTSLNGNEIYLQGDDLARFQAGTYFKFSGEDDDVVKIPIPIFDCAGEGEGIWGHYAPFPSRPYRSWTGNRTTSIRFLPGSVVICMDTSGFGVSDYYKNSFLSSLGHEIMHSGSDHWHDGAEKFSVSAMDENPILPILSWPSDVRPDYT